MYHGPLAEVSNREDLELIYQIVDSDTDDLIDLTSASIVFRVVDPECCREVLAASTDDGKITLPDATSFKVLIPRDEMSGLCQRTYEAGLTIENAGITKQFIIGTLPVLNGIVSK